METITIRYNDKQKVVLFDDFVKQSQKMLKEFGLVADAEHICCQIRNTQMGMAVDVIGAFLRDYIVK
ncbi:MAG: hypothetical protein WC373_15395 [Smithella sp.]|jgi:hypothetical protein